MANKFVIIPKELYQGLVSSKRADDDLLERAPLVHAGKELKRAQTSKQKTGVKNAMYQQKLRSYLRLRKEARDRPIKVAMDNGARVMIKSQDKGVEMKPIKQEPEEEIAVFDEDEDDWNDASTPRFASASSEPQVTPISSPKKLRNTKDKSVAKEEKIKETIDLLYDYVKSYPEDFGLTPDGEAVWSKSHNKPVTRSSTRQSIEHIVRREPGSPPGTTSLRHKLEKKHKYKQLMEGLQFGSGKKKNKRQKKIIIAAPPPTPPKFRPAKWIN